MNKLLAAILWVVALIHLLPTYGALGTNQLTALYGIPIDDPNLEILMRHRAVLFGLVGSLLVAAIYRPGLRGAAILIGLGSLTSFLWLAVVQGGYNAQLARVVAIDVVALGLLLGGSVIHLRQRRVRQS